MRIRVATPGDAGAVLGCLQAAFEPYRTSYTPDAYHDTTLTPEAFDARLRSMSVLVAVTESGDIVGTLSFHMISERVGHLRGVAVSPTWQRAGVAEALLAYAERELLSGGCDRVSLDTTEPLRQAVQFYTKHGYRFTGRVTEFFGMPLYQYEKPLTMAE